jgi:hypothetical protein
MLYAKEVSMKKFIFIIFAVLIMLFVNTFPGFAAGAGNFHGSGNFRGSGHFHGSGFSHGPRFFSGGSIWIGPGWGPWWDYPYYSYPYYPYYPAPPVINQQQQPVYVEPAPQQEEQSYWYYCPNPQGYYPYVQKCPKGWLKVIPSPVPADEGE